MRFEDGRKAFVLLVGYSDHHRLVGVNGGGKPNYEEGDFFLRKYGLSPTMMKATDFGPF